MMKVVLIRATERRGTLTGGGDVPCPVVSDAENVRETTELNEVQRKADKAVVKLDLWLESRVPTQDYEEALTLCQQMKEQALTEATSAGERAEIMGHWP
jgi:hypothetical protein